MQPKFSVIIPVFNSEQHIETCLKSLLGQTLVAIEIIAVNDGSTDKSLKILNEYAAKDRRLKVFSQKNAGPSVARNLGILNASGAYISFVDADDWLENNAYEHLDKKIEQHHRPDVVMFNAFMNDTIKNKPFLPSKLYLGDDIKNNIYPRLIESLNRSNYTALRASVWLRVFKRALVFDKIFFEKDLKNNEDLVFSFETTLSAKSFLYLGECYLYHNCITNGSLSRGYVMNSYSRLKPLFKILLVAAEKCREYDFEPQIKARVFRTFIFCCENEFHRDNKKSFTDKYNYIYQLVNNEDIRMYVSKLKCPEEKSKRIYKFCLKKKLVIPIIILARYRVHNRTLKLQYV